MPGHFVGFIDSLPTRIAASLAAVAVPVVAVLGGVSGAVGAPAPRHSGNYSSAATSEDSAAHRRRVSRAQRPFQVVVELWYQPIGFRWAQNLRLQPAPETNRFVSYYESMAEVSGTVLARDSITVR